MAKFSLIFIAFLASIAAALGQSCGKSKTPMRPNRRYDPEGQRIVGGTEARPGSHPWIVSLQQYGSHFCGGALINTGSATQSDIVVTAAHCVYDGTRNLEVAAGAHDLDNRRESGQQKVRATTTKYHPAYNADTTMNDIAIIKLDTPINFTDTVQPICLPATEEETVPDNSQAIVAGWGLTREGGSYTSNILLQVGVPTINTRECGALYRKSGIRIDSYAMICAGFKEGGKDACQGDSGGPFVVKNGDAYTLQGVVSFGIGCARPGLPGVYARVSTFLNWINNYVRIYSNTRS